MCSNIFQPTADANHDMSNAEYANILWVEMANDQGYR